MFTNNEDIHLVTKKKPSGMDCHLPKKNMARPIRHSSLIINYPKKTKLNFKANFLEYNLYEYSRQY